MDNASVFLGMNNVTSPVEDIVSGGVPSIAAEFGPLASYKEFAGAQLDFTHRWKDRKYGNAVSAAYAFSHVFSSSMERVMTEYFETGLSPARIMSDTTLASTRRRRHDVDVEINFQDTPLKSISFSVDGMLTEADLWRRASSFVASQAGNVRQDASIGSNADDLSLNASFV